MSYDREINVANTLTNVTQNAIDKNSYEKKRNVTNKKQEVPLEVEPNEGFTCQEPSTMRKSLYCAYSNYTTSRISITFDNTTCEWAQE